MAEVTERVARLEEQLAGMDQQFVEVKAGLDRIEKRIHDGLALERQERREELAQVRSDINGLRADMQTQFRWIMGGIGGAVLSVLLALLSATLVIVNRP